MTKNELNIKYVQRKRKPQRYLAGREEDLDSNDKHLIVIGAVLGFDERDSISSSTERIILE